MSEFDKQFKVYKADFDKITKRILQNRPLSSNAKKLNEYKYSLITAYNNILLLVIGNSSAHTCNLKEVQVKLARCKEQLAKCFNKLNCRVRIPPDSLSLICQSDLADSESEEEFSDAKSEASVQFSLKRSTSLPSIKDLLTISDEPSTATSSPNISKFFQEFLDMATPEQKKSFISLCASIIRENYNGDPLALESFIDKINLIEDFADENLNTTFISFLKSKLEGKAREAIPTEVSSVRQIKDALRNRIKPDNSKVVAGKIASLHVINNNYTEFAKRVEELSDALERSLIIEGMTQSKAHEMAVEQTVNVCRLNTRSDLVKSILSSTTFSDSKDVVAKMIVEQNNQVKERQVLAFRSRVNRPNSFRGSFRGHNFNRYNNNNFRQNNSNFNRYNNNADNSRYSNNGSRHNGNNFNNNRNRSSNNNRNNNSNNNSNRRPNSRSNANVRALNAHAPQERTLRAEEMDN
ncbi:PREDICTED: rho GTPase-activating protein gacZ-like [Rhagoletis zephyria]|uniref:rho GTPase-activating protein gacZ-like n=1 Tax=Rhagoletis zephyria TaxID=28612 RepID=UPI0008112491|nr:PREDICTED: rho GTPase-activating protein gacZ-like [Rhagoletis zephyria]